MRIDWQCRPTSIRTNHGQAFVAASWDHKFGPARMNRWPGDAEQERTTFGRLMRGELMSRVRSTGNKSTEVRLVTLLRGAHLKGWRRHLPILGKPDFVWRKQRVAVFVDGCFWHGHNCGKNISPRTNTAAWGEKIAATRKRDRKTNAILRRQGWRVLRVWECELRRSSDKVVRRIAQAVRPPTAQAAP